MKKPEPQCTLFDDVAIAALQGMCDVPPELLVETAFKIAKTYMELRNKHMGDK